MFPIPIRNVHQRSFPGKSQHDVGRLLDTLSTKEDLLWPHENWPSLRLDNGLVKGSKGGHGPVRYFLKEYEPGSKIIFQFQEDTSLFARGMTGTHGLFVLQRKEGDVVMQHVLEGTVVGSMWLKWIPIVRPLHDALMEDCFDKAQRALGIQPAHPAQYSMWVRFLLSLFSLLQRKKKN